jgi:hypothetical protein
MLYQGSATTAWIAFASVVVWVAAMRLGSELIFRVMDPPGGVRPAEAEDYSEEYAGVVVSSDRKTATAEERVPGIAVAVLIVAVCTAVCIVFFHQLGFLAVLGIVISIVVGIDTGRTITSHRVARRPTAPTGGRGPVQG